MTSRAPAILDILGSQGVEALIQSLRAITMIPPAWEALSVGIYGAFSHYS